MPCRLAACLFTVVIPVLATPHLVLGQQKQPPQSDSRPIDEQDLKKGLMGVWQLVAGYNQGRKLTPQEIAGTTVVVKDLSMITYDADQRERYRAKYILDTSSDPLEVTMTAEIDGKPPGKALGIIKTVKAEDEQRISGWTLCYGLPGHPRPETFESPPGSAVMLFRLERAQLRRE
jgi:uncharacterized protein (TIGR03067 family)